MTSTASDRALPAPAAPTALRPWRKRHPVLARLLLYGLGLGLCALLLWLLLGRRAVDAEDRLDYLRARLETLTVVLQADAQGAEVLKVLDAEYGAPDLAPDVRSRALRLRGIVARNRKDAAGMNASYAEARRLLSRTPLVRVIETEWALCRVDLGDAAGARSLLGESVQGPLALPASEGGMALALWQTFLSAQVRAAEGDGDGARTALHVVLDGLVPPLPSDGPGLWLGLRSWQGADVAVEMSRWLAAGLPSGSPAAKPIWIRLSKLGANSLDAQLLAAEGLALAGDRASARVAWKRALELNAPGARLGSERNPTLKGLDTP